MIDLCMMSATVVSGRPTIGLDDIVSKEESLFVGGLCIS